mmetsp:Transcript_2121/g.6728  ORF Transcript_2121/g.6728 Transcript_2121/m.6728 type:complete len:106 (-) Transcript_2121:199-516(-)
MNPNLCDTYPRRTRPTDFGIRQGEVSVPPCNDPVPRICEQKWYSKIGQKTRKLARETKFGTRLELLACEITQTRNAGKWWCQYGEVRPPLDALTYYDLKSLRRYA